MKRLLELYLNISCILPASECDKFNRLCVYSPDHDFKNGSKLPLTQMLLLSLLIHYNSMKSKYFELVTIEVLMPKARLLDIDKRRSSDGKTSSHT